jgi:hypothetical protein
MDNGINIGSSVPVVAGSASITTTLPPGTHTLTAMFAGHCPTGSYPGFTIGCLGGTTSTSNAVTYVVNPPPPIPSPTPTSGVTDTTTTLQVAPSPGFTFFPEILTARVAPADAVGTVQFLDGTTPLGRPAALFGGFARLITTLPAGTHSLTAIFLPPNLGIGGCATTAGFDGSTPLPCPASDGFMPSASAPVSLTVQSLFGGLSFWPLSPPFRVAGR